MAEVLGTLLVIAFVGVAFLRALREARWSKRGSPRTYPCTVGEHMDAAYSAMPCPKCQAAKE